MNQPRYLDRHDYDLALLAAGDETGWWDDTGAPAPWPEDFWMADGSINPDWTTATPTPDWKELDNTDPNPF